MPAVVFGVLNHFQGYPVLYAACRVEALEFRENVYPGIRVESVDTDHRGVPYGPENIVLYVHVRIASGSFYPANIMISQKYRKEYRKINQLLILFQVFCINEVSFHDSR